MNTRELRTLSALAGVALVAFSNNDLNALNPPPRLSADKELLNANGRSEAEQANFEKRVTAVKQAFPHALQTLKLMSDKQILDMLNPKLKAISTQEFVLKVSKAFVEDLKTQKLISKDELASLETLEKSPIEYYNQTQRLLLKRGFLFKACQLKLEFDQKRKHFSGVFQSASLHDIKEFVPDDLDAFRKSLESDPAFNVKCFDLGPLLIGTTMTTTWVESKLMVGSDVILVLSLPQIRKMALDQEKSVPQVINESLLSLLSDLQIGEILQEPTVLNYAKINSLSITDIRGLHRDFIHFRVLETDTCSLITDMLNGDGFGGDLSKALINEVIQEYFPALAPRRNKEINIKVDAEDVPEVREAIIHAFEQFFAELCKDIPDSE